MDIVDYYDDPQLEVWENPWAEVVKENKNAILLLGAAVLIPACISVGCFILANRIERK